MKFLDEVYFDNTVRSYLAVAISILLALILKRIISKYATFLLFKLFKQKESILDKKTFDSLIIVPVERVLVVLISIFAIDRLNFPHQLIFTIHKVTSHDIVDGLATAIIIACFISLIIRFIDLMVMLIKHKSNTGNKPGEYQLLFFFKDFIRAILIIIGIILILKFSLKLDIGNLLTGLSIVGAAMALAARESLENLIASFIIFFDKPFETGDVVKVNSITGTVERIGLRSTRLRTPEKSLVTVPNKQMVDSILDNWSVRNLIRNEIKTLLSPHTTAENLEKAIKEIEAILTAKKEKIPSYSVYLQEINNDSAVIMVIYFTTFPMDTDSLNKLKEEINLEIRKMQEANEIKPSSTTSVTLVNH
jgi:MscS family membrane protein